MCESFQVLELKSHSKLSNSFKLDIEESLLVDIQIVLDCRTMNWIPISNEVRNREQKSYSLFCWDTHWIGDSSHCSHRGYSLFLGLTQS